MIQTDLIIIGAGPVGLFTVFEAGLLKLRCHLVDILPQPGGQLTEIYPKKPIYDIPGLPSILAKDLTANLIEQIQPFHPTFSLGERAEKLERTDTGDWRVTTSEGTLVQGKVVVLAAGLGSFEPRKPPIPALARYENKGVDYFIKDPEKYRDKDILIAGGGDSALDWTLDLVDVARTVWLVHRRSEFRGAPDSIEKVMRLVEMGQVHLLTNAQVIDVHGDQERLRQVVISSEEMGQFTQNVDHFIPLFGLTPKLGPLEHWGLETSKEGVQVSFPHYETNVPGIFAVGDINTYEGKLKLILCGFHEATLMVQRAFHYVHPDQKLSFKYTTVMGEQGLLKKAESL
ncbi:MAG: NAD(P)/FAD-dependent oxidoreductase [Saprospiraceae bacterium]